MGNKFSGRHKPRPLEKTTYFVVCTKKERDDIYKKIVSVIGKDSILSEAATETGFMFMIDVTANEHTLLRDVGIFSLVKDFAMKLV